MKVILFLLLNLYIKTDLRYHTSLASHLNLTKVDQFGGDTKCFI